MKVAFTGTRKGMSPHQKKVFRKFCEKHAFDMTTFHHGSCIGADKDASDIVWEVCAAQIAAHPCTLVKQQAHTKAHTRYPALDPIERNHVMVDAADILIACPATAEEVLRSGTWATIRYAKKMGKEVKIINPRQWRVLNCKDVERCKDE